VEHERGALCERCAVAPSHLARARGLLGRRDLAPGDGMLFPRTSSIHMFFMRFAIDVVFLDRELRVLKIVSDLKPWRMARCPRAKWALELAAGECERRGLEVGDALTLSAS
jgi:uncharacterized membrane protein (UPF0127 family)